MLKCIHQQWEKTLIFDIMHEAIINTVVDIAIVYAYKVS